FDHHDLNPELFNVKYGDKKIFSFIMKIIERFAFKVADVIISPNESYKEIAIKRGNHEVENIFIVRNSIYSRNLHEDMIKSNKKITIGYLGEIDKHDGLSLFVYAVEFLIKENNGIKFICSIIGDGPELLNIKHLVEKLKLDIYFTFHGRLWGNDLSQILNEFDIGVVPDSDNEFNQLSTMGKIFEYMSYSIPMVQFDLKENRRISEGAALFAKPDNSTDFGEKLYQLLSNSALRKILGSHALHKIRHDFCWEKQEKNLLNAYQRVINI
ncbi:glycosyltransferase, partial [archaeon]|nr:glycosyltransferase [archaeon]